MEVLRAIVTIVEAMTSIMARKVKMKRKLLKNREVLLF